MKTKRFFSLLELIVCLGILAVLASLLLDNFADVKARECEEFTRKRGGQVRMALKGRFSPGGVSAFLSDMGRFPSLYIPAEGDGSGGRRLAELYDPSIWYTDSETGETALQREETVTASQIQTICRTPAGSSFPADSSGISLPYPDVSMPVGWNGPYVSVASPMKGNFFDGWGNPWKIITNYNLHVSGGRLTENTSSSNPVRILSTSLEINALRDTANNKRVRIDGIASFGANDADDSSETEVSAPDADQRFLFPHNMDNHLSENLASLTVILKIRDVRNGDWVTAPFIPFWVSGASYSAGALCRYGTTIYYCTSTHTAGSSFSSAGWEAASLYDPAVHGLSSSPKLCLYNNTYYLRKNTLAESVFTQSNWSRIAAVSELPDNLSLLLFAPVMQGSYDKRVMKLGYYHFFRNASGENAHGVRPLYGTGSGAAADIDCDDVDVSTVCSTSYNGRCLTAEDHSRSTWNDFRIRRLVPGSRKIFCITFNSLDNSCYSSQAELVTLRPGNNIVTLYLEQKL